MDDSLESNKSRHSKSLFILLALVGIISTAGLIKDLSSQGFRPFGFIEGIVAQIAPDAPGSAVSQINTPLLRKVFDSTDRCRPAGSNPLMTGKGGVNLAVLDAGSGNIINNFSHGINDLGEQMNMGYQLAMFTTPESAPEAAQFIIDTSKNGMIPVIRMCYPGGCEFKIEFDKYPLRNTDNVSEMNDGVTQSNFASRDIVNFYQGIITELDRRIGGTKVFEQDISNLQGYEFIALVGPNEPGTAGEMEAFGITNYNDLVRVVNEAGYYLQKERVVNGGIMYLAPGAFNLSNTQGDDLKEFFGPLDRSKGGLNVATQNGTVLRTDFFDYVLGNAYNQDANPADPEVNLASEYVNVGNGATAFNLNYVSEKYDLPIILTEFGTFIENDTTLIKQAFTELCQNDNVQGILFFRNVGELAALSPEPRPLQLTTDVIRDMTLGCTRKVQFPNCNFDTQLYTTERTLSATVPLSASTADSFCSVSDPDYATKVAVTGGSGYRIVCGPADGGKVHCSAGGINTVQIGLPINSFGSNSSFGTRTRPFPSYNLEAFASQTYDNYEALNQFAGLVKIGSVDYPMPWLGSAIQNSSETILYNTRYETEYVTPKLSPGIETYSTLADIEADKSKGVARSIPYYTSAISSNGFIPDERTIVAKDEFGNDEINIDKALISDVQILRDYNPETFNSSAKFPAYPISCGAEGRYVVNNDDYIYGPEIQVGSRQVWEGSGGKMCAAVARRNFEGGQKIETLDPINCEVLTDQFYISPTSGTAYSCSNAMLIFDSACGLSDDAINSGFCNIDENVADACLTFVPPDTGFRGVRVYAYSDTLQDVDANIEIPGIYDSLFRLKDLMNKEFKDMDLKVVMGEGYGWEVDVVITARDGQDIANQVNYKYLPNAAEGDVSNFSGEAIKMSTPNYVVPQFLPAKEISQKVNKSYIKDLEYINQINEIRSVYLTGSQPQNLSAYFSDTTNPFYDPNDSSKPNYNRQNILINDTTSQLMSYPLFTCDQVNICKQYSQSDLVAQGFELELAEKLCPLPGSTKLNPGIQISCITDIIDSRQNDKLDTELCRRGYNIDTNCKLQCIPAGGDTDTPDLSEFPVGESTIQSLFDVQPSLISMTSSIESHMGLPQGMLIALMEREITGAVKTLEGEAYKKLYERKGNNPVWGPAQFHDISWYGDEYRPISPSGLAGTGYGELDGRGFSLMGGNTQSCLNHMGYEYNDPKYMEPGKSDVLERSYLGFALCAAAAKLKNDSQTDANNSSNWSQDDVFKAAKAYLGDCSQFDRPYCRIYVETICNTYAAENPVLCAGVPPRPKPTGEICIPIFGDEDELDCLFDDITLRSPLKDSGPLVVTRKWGTLLHSGMDLAAHIGDDVVASAAGKVVAINREAQQPSNGLPQIPGSPGYAEGAGNFVKIFHSQFKSDSTVWTSYQHLSVVSENLKVGDYVVAGQVIGKVGTTGRTTGPHLHLELRHTDCYDGYGESGFTLGQCSADPQKYMFVGTTAPQCVGGAAGIMEGDFACPVTNPEYISQNSQGCNERGQCGASHSKNNAYNQHQQLPTDIRATGQEVIAPIDGTIIEVRDPEETLDSYFPRGSICDNIMLPDGSDTYYDGGFVVHLLDGEGRLWRFVHLEDLRMNEGDVVTKGTRLGRVYDGVLGVEPFYKKLNKYGNDNWAPWSVGSTPGCFSISNQHLHFAIIDAATIAKGDQAPYFEGNSIDSTPWVKKYCNIN